jgi:hypothetical protein
LPVSELLVVHVSVAVSCVLVSSESKMEETTMTDAERQSTIKEILHTSSGITDKAMDVAVYTQADLNAMYVRALEDAANIIEPDPENHSELIPSAITAKRILALQGE